MATLTAGQVEAYLARIDVESCPRPTDEALRELQWRHLRSVPFENLSIHLGEPISLATDDLFEKIVRRRRGGFCYELNGTFAALLTELGFDVSRLAGRVFTPSGLGPPFDHLALSVGGWLVDVGFGRHSAYPLRVDTEDDQDDPCGVFRVVRTAEGDLEVYRDGSPQYRLEPRPRDLVDFEPTCWFQQTHPRSHFRVGPVCSRLSETAGMVTLAGRLLIRTEDGHRTETTLSSDEEVLGAYRDHFGVDLDRVPTAVTS